MNELLAIIIIVIVCCAMFFAWLISMATCPDKMVNWISGAANSATGTVSNESKELIVPPDDDDDSVYDKKVIGHNSNIFLQLSASRRTSKKLSVVPEQDENLTVQSMRNQPRPSILQYQQHFQQHQSPQTNKHQATIVEADVEQEPGTYREEIVQEVDPEQQCYDYQATISSTTSSIELRNTSPPPELPLKFSHVLHHSLGDVVHAV